jgi:phage N-6-adenine-methyltransferase
MSNTINPECIKCKESDLWQTPVDFFIELDKEFKFDYDVCANFSNKLKPCLGDYFSSDYSNCVCFMNPPYSKPNKFVERAIDLAKSNVKTVCLLKCDTSTKLFHRLYGKYEVRFIQGRLKFTHPIKSNKHGSTFASMVVIIK